jgi:hypothetical protein
MNKFKVIFLIAIIISQVVFVTKVLIPQIKAAPYDAAAKVCTDNHDYTGAISNLEMACEQYGVTNLADLNYH